jgi:glycosyltransferase involved in cell wall biosynthesis
MSLPRTLMLVSARADARLRADVAAGRRPNPEYLRLERDHGVVLCDWSQLGIEHGRRSAGLSIRHTAAALQRMREFDVVFSDGEHVGIPLALAMRVLGDARPHLMIAHHLTTRLKRLLFTLFSIDRGVTRIVFHSRHQLERARQQYRIAGPQLAFLPYGIDADFWSPISGCEEPVIVSAGQEHRDYLTLAQACGDLPQRVIVARGSAHSPDASSREPDRWSPDFELVQIDHCSLRALYARAQVVVIPLTPTDFQAGVTTLLEAMAMGKACVVSATDGQADILQDGVSGLYVPPGDAGELRRAVRFLIARPDVRARLGWEARQLVATRYHLNGYASSLATHLNELADLAVGQGRRPDSRSGLGRVSGQQIGEDAPAAARARWD